MQIVSFIPDSFSEFEGEHALTLFSKGCNLRCPECYNLNDILHNESIGNAIDILENHISPMHTGVVFLGGEPTIWKNKLIEAMEWCKRNKLKTKVFTNGLNPDAIALINYKKLADAYSIDLKSVSNFSEVMGVAVVDKGYLNKIDQSISNIIESNVNLELRTTLWDSMKGQRQEIDRYIKDKYPKIKHIWQTKFIF